MSESSEAEIIILDTPSTSRSAEKMPIAREVDPDFYFESVFVVFQVENCLFRVPTHLFVNESQFFAGMFRLPQPNGNHDVEGSAPSNPIIMPPDIKREDFRNLMKALYPLSVALTLSLSKSEWISILKLSTMWYFINLREIAISELEKSSKISYIDKITLGRKYSISSWVVSGLEGMVNRDDTISDEEAIDMDYITTVKLFRLRELRLKKMLPGPASKKIEEVFVEEVAFIRSNEEGFKASEEDIPFVEPSPFEDSKDADTNKKEGETPGKDILSDNQPASLSVFAQIPSQNIFGFSSASVSFGEASESISKPRPKKTGKALKPKY